MAMDQNITDGIDVLQGDVAAMAIRVDEVITNMQSNDVDLRGRLDSHITRMDQRITALQGDMQHAATLLEGIQPQDLKT